jgi:hypothetical protein
MRDLRFEVDMPEHDPRPVNPAIYGEEKLSVYNPNIRLTELHSVKDLFPYLPGNITMLRIYVRESDIDLDGIRALNEAAESALNSSDGYATNI